MLQIQQKLTPYNFTTMNGKNNTFIVIHYTGATGTAKNNVDYFAREKLQASANYFVDNESIWQCVEDKNRAWHCGGGLQGNNGHSFYKVCTNSNSIGIEMCCKKDNAGNLIIEAETVNNTIDLVKYLMKKHNIPLEKVIRHYDVTGKICPAPYVNETAWQGFKNKITEESEMTSAEKKDFEELVHTVEAIDKDVQNIKNKMVYAWVDDNMPEYARPTITKLINKGYLKGDEEGKLNLDDNMLRMLVINDRAGIYGE